MKRKNAFTLVELLVVISIIALLLSILMPSLARVRELARQTVCATKEKQLVLGAKLWSEDNGDWAVAGDWFKEPGSNETESSLLPYLNASSKDTKRRDDVIVCPSAKNIHFFQVDPSFNTKGHERILTYAVNGYIALNFAPYGEGSPGTQGPTGARCGGYGGPDNLYWTVHGVTKMAAIRKPQDTVFFIDHEYYCAMSWTFDPTKPYIRFPENYRFKTRWHNTKSGGNYKLGKISEDYGIGMIGWVDGHVEREPADFARPGPNASDPSKGARWRYYFYDH